MGKELSMVEERLSNLLQQCKLDSYVSTDSIKRWIKDINEDPMTIVTMLTGLLNKEKLVDAELFQNLINTTVKLSHLLPTQKLKGLTYFDVLKEREKRGEPTNVIIKTTTLPPMKWTDYYYKAMLYMSKQNFVKASKEFDKTFEKLLETKTTSQDIYRVFCNAGISYLFSGKPFLGLNCLKIALELNPKYTFASEQLKKYEQGEFNEIIQFGFLSMMKNNIEEWEKRPDYLVMDKVLKWPEKKILNKLSLFGVSVDKQEFIKVAQTVNYPETLAEKLFYPQANIKGEDEDFIWIAAYALWNIYCPDIPCVPNFNDLIHKSFTFVSKTDEKNKKNKEKQEDYEKACADYFERLQPYIFCKKKDFLKDWQKTIDLEMNPSYELKTFLVHLLENPKFEKKVLEITNYLIKQIPHPDWNGIELISCIIHNDPKWNELYKELKKKYPFYCYLAYDLAQYYFEKKNYLHAEFYLTEALKIIDNRVEKNMFSIDTIKTTIYDDYMHVINFLEDVLEKSNADLEKRKLLNAKKQLVEKNSKIYSKSPNLEKYDNAMDKLFTKLEKKETEKSSAFQYFKYLSKFGINFESEKPVETKETILKIQPESFLSTRKQKEENHWNKKYGSKIGRNDPCPCGSGKKYKKCCLEKDRKRFGM
ncbi:MAG: SEC-C metal-binding domain-containing protein [Candidatus Thermoplasmatota archaeon]|jgi:hypothetical protein|nr:SEC-C metal-binding domain-containing protein [Candidatus Thermoplasmatota archaeon]